MYIYIYIYIAMYHSFISFLQVICVGICIGAYHVLTLVQDLRLWAVSAYRC